MFFQTPHVLKYLACIMEAEKLQWNRMVAFAVTDTLEHGVKVNELLLTEPTDESPLSNYKPCIYYDNLSTILCLNH